MRIISQEGRGAFYDFPYDKCLVYIYGDKKAIKIQPLGEVDSDYTSNEIFILWLFGGG